jgi:formylmethanofuran dehydrogenase subunit D
MATIETTGQMTLLELAKRHGPDQRLMRIADIATERNEILQDMVWVEANGIDSHTFNQKISEPEGTWGRINRGGEFETMRSRQIKSDIKMLEGYNQIDERLLMKFREPAAARAQEDMAYLAGMTKNIVRTMLYGNANVNPDQLHGLYNRSEFTSLGAQCLDNGGGAGTGLTDIWLMRHSADNGIFFFYPSGDATQMIQSRDLGRELVYDANGKPYQAYVSYHKYNIGYDIVDPRNIIRIANVDPDSATSTQRFDPDVLIDALAQMYDQQGVVIYVSRATWANMVKYAKDKTNIEWAPEEYGGRWIRSFIGLPVKLIDQLASYDTAVS